MAWGQESSRRIIGAPIAARLPWSLRWKVLGGLLWPLWAQGNLSNKDKSNSYARVLHWKTLVVIWKGKDLRLACHHWFHNWGVELPDLALRIDLASSQSPSTVDTHSKKTNKKQSFILLCLLIWWKLWLFNQFGDWNFFKIYRTNLVKILN